MKRCAWFMLLGVVLSTEMLPSSVSSRGAQEAFDALAGRPC
jgi:hypothetical protein